MNNIISAEQREWLLKTAWKKHTLKEIAMRLNINVSNITQLYKRHDIEPVKKRDRIASQLIDLRNSGNRPLKSGRELALMFDCSEVLIKDIIKEYKLDIKIRAYKTKQEKPATEHEIKIQAAKEHDSQILDMRKRRAEFAVYTQSSSQLIDECRGLKTTLRPKTYLTNANL